MAQETNEYRENRLASLKALAEMGFTPYGHAYPHEDLKVVRAGFEEGKEVSVAGRLLMIDIGGGSLEVAFGSDEEPTIAAAVNAGAGVVTRDLLPGGMASPKDLESIHKKVRKMIAPVVDAVPAEDYSSHAVGTSKAIRSLARLAGTVIHQPGREDALCVERGQLEDWIPRLAAIEPAQRAALPGITQDRAMTIVGAGIIAVEIMRALGINEIEVCPWALREGAILRWLDQYGRTRFGF